MKINLTAVHWLPTAAANQPQVVGQYECSLEIDLTGLFPVRFSQNDRDILLFSQYETLDFFDTLEQLKRKPITQHPHYAIRWRFDPKSTHPLEIIDTGRHGLEHRSINFTREETLKILKNLKPHHKKFRELLIKTSEAQWEAKQQQKQAEEKAEQIRRQEAQELLDSIVAQKQAEAELLADHDSIRTPEEWHERYGDPDRPELLYDPTRPPEEPEETWDDRHPYR